MIRQVTLLLNEATNDKKDRIIALITEYLIFMQKVINTLWNHKIFFGRFVPKKWYEGIRTSLTERYKQCAAKQALAIVKSQRKRVKKKPVVHSASLELDERFVRIENGHNSFDLWVKLSILNGRPIYIPTRKHRMFNKYVNEGWKLSRSCRLRKTEKGLFLDVFFKKEAEPVKEKGVIVGLDLGFRKLATLSDGQTVGKELKSEIMKFYKRKRSHLIIKEFINRELKKIDFSKIRILVVERLRNVKKNKRGVFTHHANRLLSHWAYRHALSRLAMLCEENRVQIAEVEPRGTSKACNRCGSRGIRWDERFVCPRCGWKVDADYNAALNIRDCFISQGGYGPLPESHLDISFG
ncbi:MAG: zinc ribbon domain-containing protein [Candidatus Freyarchaeota archaeon]